MHCSWWSGFQDKSISETWVDPIIIGRVKFPAGKKWLFQLRADVGGFGIGSDFAWQAHGMLVIVFQNYSDLGLVIVLLELITKRDQKMIDSSMMWIPMVRK